MSDTKDRPKWKAVISKIPRREGEAFVMCGDTFVLKVYKQDAIPDTFKFAHYLADQMNRLEELKEQKNVGEKEHG